MSVVYRDGDYTIYEATKVRRDKTTALGAMYESYVLILSYQGYVLKTVTYGNNSGKRHRRYLNRADSLREAMAMLKVAMSVHRLKAEATCPS